MSEQCKNKNGNVIMVGQFFKIQRTADQMERYMTSMAVKGLMFLFFSFLFCVFFFCIQ